MILSSELFNKVTAKCCEHLAEACDEMQGDSDEARAETHRLISELFSSLRALDQHTDGLLLLFLSFFLSNFCVKLTAMKDS